MTVDDALGVGLKFAPPLAGVAITMLFQRWQAGKKRKEDQADKAHDEERALHAKTAADAEAQRQQRVAELIRAAHDRAEESIENVHKLRHDLFEGLSSLAAELRLEHTNGHHRVRTDMQSAVTATNARLLEVEKALSGVQAILKEREP